MTTGHVYVYTERGQTAAVLQGISGVSTAEASVPYTWYEDSTGTTYDVQEYFVTSLAGGDTMSFQLADGQVNALQLTPLPPHPIPEPNTIALLGIGGLISLVMRKRAFFVGEA
ncbi:PEP-CTERM sorting domain-containing protein [Chlorobaculum sp. 24CR]|uniref:PEP-CTERM sorting domain-containing protein n=1 Tax=Chlorobaculum sp. 24CR TaxID=2508878 RepID=UPI00100BE26D|nr:PEP-CTERM sorting domain-containing protein [Chlorobaculum sp. 24CR]RXK81091.1 PEP-CTERM sorting domain-containing protein [Chlorobaculum sp. 24CR]